MRDHAQLSHPGTQIVFACLPHSPIVRLRLCYLISGRWRRKRPPLCGGTPPATPPYKTRAAAIRHRRCQAAVSLSKPLRISLNRCRDAGLVKRQRLVKKAQQLVSLALKPCCNIPANSDSDKPYHPAPDYFKRFRTRFTSPGSLIYLHIRSHTGCGLVAAKTDKLGQPPPASEDSNH